MKRRPGARATRKTSGEPTSRASSTLAASATLTRLQLQRRSRRGDRVLTRRGLRGALFLGLGTGGLFLEAALDRLEQALHGERLADVLNDSEPLGVGLVPAALVGGDHDDGRGV